MEKLYLAFVGPYQRGRVDSVGKCERKLIASITGRHKVSARVYGSIGELYDDDRKRPRLDITVIHKGCDTQSMVKFKRVVDTKAIILLDLGARSFRVEFHNNIAYVNLPLEADLNEVVSRFQNATQGSLPSWPWQLVKDGVKPMPQHSYRGYSRNRW